MKPNLPQVPDPKLLESMCMRYDHAHGIKQYCVDGFKWRIETDEEFENRKESNRRIMRQLYEEVSGHGFYQYPEDDNEG